MTKDNYLDLFDFQGTDKEKDELRSYVESLSELPTGKKILEKAKHCLVKKPISVFYKEDTCEWGGAGANYEEGHILIQPKMKLENVPEEKREQKKKKLITLMGHELLHLTQKNLHEIKVSNLLQNIYKELLIEGDAYATEEILKAELDNRPVSSYREKFKSFVTAKQPKSQQLSFLYTGHYIDSVIKSMVLKPSSDKKISQSEFQGQLQQSLEDPKLLDGITLKQCGWYHPRPMGGSYIEGDKTMVWLSKDNLPIYVCFFEQGHLNSIVFPSKVKNPKKQGFGITGDRPLFDSEILALRKDLDSKGKGDLTLVKSEEKLPKTIHNFCDFIKWQNKLQSERIKAINPRYPIGC